MSVDILLKEFPADEKLYVTMQAIGVINDFERKPLVIPRERPLVTVFAEELIRFGQEGVKESYRNYEPRHDDNMAFRLRVQVETAAILLGGVVLALQAGLETDVIDLGGIVENVNSVLSETTLNRSCRVPEEPIIYLTESEWRAMIECLRKDCTFSAFFDEPHYLPSVLHEYLQKEKVYGMPFLGCIQVHILSDFRERARFLLPPKVPQCRR